MPPTQVREELKKVLDAQPKFSAAKSPEMDARHAALFAARDLLCDMLAGQVWAKGLEVDAKDGTGSRSRVPWIRVYDPKRSPAPTAGYYVVFLFQADGEGVYLSVNQGTQLWTEGHLGNQSPDSIQKRADLARQRSQHTRSSWPSAGTGMDLRVPPRSMPKNYEAGNVAAVLYERLSLPDDDMLLDGLERAIAVYRSVDVEPDSEQALAPSTPKTIESKFAAPAVPTFAEIATQAASALSAAGLRFGDDASHHARVRDFLASLATRRFVVLAGLSGSGKTQLARRVGQWLGRARVKVVPVRPDWTGPEALLGFEDALQPRVNGSPAWHVPPVLDFLLRARDEPQLPFVLVLDEMNLAHVERYFADVLSGMETRDGCLPDVLRTKGAPSRLVGAVDQHPFPTNVFVVGTVNVDETTYQFSPKVLDRASTVEFRVTTEALVSARTIDDVTEADAETRDAFLALSCDEGWHLQNPPPWAAGFSDRVRGLHRILVRDRFEFGHRTYFEAQRLAALLASDGATLHEALDTFVLQKVLPRLHGGRKRLERCLDTLIWYCALAPDDMSAQEALDSREAPRAPVGGASALPNSQLKVERMKQTLLEQQFASFAE
jgi:5-methylcytosine-specific restriction protein B